MTQIKTQIIRLIMINLCWSFGCDSPEPEDDASVDASNDADVELDSDATDADVNDADSPNPCIDSDGDGYGVNCQLGLDCDDGNPAIWTTCDDRDPCDRLHAGCGCSHDGEELPCRTEGALDTVDGENRCYLGSRICTDGVWSPCLGMEPYPFEYDEDEASGGSGTRRQPVLGRPESCEGLSCDRNCSRVHDCLSAPDLQGDASENLIHDLRGRPPAIILQDTTSTGTFRRTIESSCTESEHVEWYTLRTNLVAEEPALIVIRVRTADDEAALATAEWAEVLRCPGGSCVSPEHPTDRDFDEGNVRRWLGEQGAHRPWLEIEVTLSAGGGVESPRYISHDLFFFCDPA